MPVFWEKMFSTNNTNSHSLSSSVLGIGVALASFPVVTGSWHNRLVLFHPISSDGETKAQSRYATSPRSPVSRWPN